MRARTLILGATALAVLALVANAAAMTGTFVVAPTSPVIGKSALIKVKVNKSSGETLPAVLYLKVTSPRGGGLQVPLTRVGKTMTWKTVFAFADKGTWKLSAVAGKGGSTKAGTSLGSTTVDVKK